MTVKGAPDDEQRTADDSDASQVPGDGPEGEHPEATPNDDEAGEQREPEGWAGRLRAVTGVSTFWIAVVLVLLVVGFAVAEPSKFATVANARNVVLDAASLLLLAVGSTYVIVTAGIDLSVGSVLVFSGVVSAKVMLAFGNAGSGAGIIFLGFVVAMAAGVAWGVLNGFVIAKGNVPALIVTLGTLGMSLGLADILTNGVDISGIPNKLNSSIGAGEVIGIPWLVIIVAVVTIVFGLILASTRFGRYTYAVGSNHEGARRAGIAVDAHLIKVYAISGGLAGLAGYLNLARFTTTTIGGHSTDNLNAIAAVVIGGTSLFGGVGTIIGSVIGIFIPAILQNGFTIIGVQPYWEAVAVGAVLIIAVYIDQLRRRSRQRG